MAELRRRGFLLGGCNIWGKDGRIGVESLVFLAKVHAEILGAV
jgi:hypothetical protein